MTERYRNKLFSVLGDSISALEGTLVDEGLPFYPTEDGDAGIFSEEDIWWGMVLNRLGGKLLVNDSRAGTLVCRHKWCETQSYGCSDERTGALKDDKRGISPDVILIFMGMNDVGMKMKLTPSSESEKDDISVFSVAYSVMLDKIVAAYPAAQVWCLSLPYAERYSQEAKKSAIGHGCGFIELGKYSTFDGLHPDKKGMECIAVKVIDALDRDHR